MFGLVVCRHAVIYKLTNALRRLSTVAVAGLPEYRHDVSSELGAPVTISNIESKSHSVSVCLLQHAVVMARVARDCVMQTHELTRQLELKLGPDTSDLSIRVGLHSGPVTGKEKLLFTDQSLVCVRI